LELRAELLDDRLDHEVAMGEIGEVGGQRQLSERGLPLVRRLKILVDLALEKVRDPAACSLAELIRDLATDSLVARFHRKLSDPGTHGAEPNNSDALDLRVRHDGRS